MSSVRTFLGINFPVAAVRRMVDEARALSKVTAQAGFDVAWVPAANIHLTLKFLGGIPADSVEAVRGRLARGLVAHEPFELEARGLGAFPDARRPRILWVGVRPSAPLAALQQEVESWMEELGFAREERDFHPHLTIGRVKGRRRTPHDDTIPPDGGGGGGEERGLDGAIASRENTLFGVARVAEVVIYESRTMRSGAEYVALGRLPLGAAPATGSGPEPETRSK